MYMYSHLLTEVKRLLQCINLCQYTIALTHFIRDTPRVVPGIFENIFINIRNIENYLTESCSEGHKSA